MIFDNKRIKRQIEILGLCISKNRDKITVTDLSIIFNVGEATIERDLNELRSRGIAIHSQAGLGVIVKSETSESLLKDELINYFGICYTSSYEDLIINDLQNYAIKQPLEVFVILQKSIERSEKVKVKFINDEIKSVEPRIIIRKNKEWYLVCKNQSQLEYYKLTSIVGVRAQNEFFNKDIKEEELKQQIEKHFETKISKPCDIKLSFKMPINGNIPTQLLKVKMISKDSKGRDILQAECNNIEELVTWIFSNTGSVFVIEPKELRERIILIAEVIVKHQKSIDEEDMFPEETAKEKKKRDSSKPNYEEETLGSIEPSDSIDNIESDKDKHSRVHFSMGNYDDEIDENKNRDLLIDENKNRDLLYENIDLFWDDFYSEGSMYSINADFEDDPMLKYYRPCENGYEDFEVELKIAI